MGLRLDDPTDPTSIPTGYVKIAIENGHFIVDSSMKNGDVL